ncbi:MAG: HD domain-containing protein [Holophaga sp.]|nr:HD domain-containing protein [Holophaga sp.]
MSTLPIHEPLLRLEQALGPGSGLVLVGGAVRDRLLGRDQGDWDLATALLPDMVMARARAAGLQVIPTGLQHGTVTVMVGGRPMEITTYRGDDAYLDGRHPESVRLGVDLEEDLARRDFTVNAMALPIRALDAADWKQHLVDPFGGQDDLKARRLRAVGDPLRRFAEDGLRPLRACRFVAQLGFEVEPATAAAIPKRLEVAGKVSVERVHQELTKLLCGPAVDKGLDLLRATGLLALWLPELSPMVGCAQNRHHAFDVWGHTLEVLRCVPAEPVFRWAALLHDSGKPSTRTLGTDGEAHFFGHEARSLVLAEHILLRLRASRALLKAVQTLIRHHGMYPDHSWGDAACRRFLARLGVDGLTLEDWGRFRQADHLGKGVDSETALQHHGQVMARLQALAEAAPALSVKDLALDGKALMALANRPGGPWLGQLQGHLLETVLEDPSANAAESLRALAEDWLKS